jgi:hypothetical protein
MAVVVRVFWKSWVVGPCGVVGRVGGAESNANGLARILVLEFVILVELDTRARNTTGHNLPR